MSEWVETKVSELCDLIVDCVNRTAPAVDYPTPFKMIRTTNVRNGKIDTSQVNYVTEETYKAWIRRGKPIVGDIILTREAPVGEVGIVRTDENIFLGQRMMMYRAKKELICPSFLYYSFLTSYVKEQVLSTGMGSVVEHIRVPDAKEFLIKHPPLPEQKAIAQILSSLDDKIDLLHRQNKTLEAISETLFRQWFIEEAQDDWGEGPLDDMISVKGGTTPSTKEPEYWDGDIHWTSPRDLSNHNSVFLFDTDRKITEKGLAQIGSGLLPIGTVLLSSRAPIGYLAITDIPVAINQGYIAIICDKSISNYFMYLWCKANMEKIKNAGNGSVFQEISKSNFKTLEIQIPSSRILDNFERAISPTFEKIKANQKQIQTLEKLRDTLLPKLMSGEVRVKL